MHIHTHTHTRRVYDNDTRVHHWKRVIAKYCFYDTRAHGLYNAAAVIGGVRARPARHIRAIEITIFRQNRARLWAKAVGADRVLHVLRECFRIETLRVCARTSVVADCTFSTTDCGACAFVARIQ